jgi:AcrR family transcriptional regulator
LSYGAASPRERVLEAMVRVAAVAGYEAATVGEVVERAGVSREEFDAMFASKDVCFLEAYDALLDILVGAFREAYEVAAEESWSARMTAGLRALLELLAAEAEIARLALVDIAAIGEDARYRYRLAMDRFLPFAEEGRAAAPGGAALPEETARFAVGSGEAMVFDEIRAGRAGELPAMLPDLVFAVTMPYLGAEAAEEAMRSA